MGCTDRRFLFVRQRGLTLVQVLVASALVAVVSIGFMRVMEMGFRGTRSNELKADAVALTNTLRQTLDCDRTFALGVGGGPIDVATHCGAAPVPITLYSRTGAPITGPVSSVSGAFDPTSASFEGAGRLGDWELRAYCEAAVGSLVVRAARRGAGQVFLADPMTKRVFDWTKPPNPFLGGPTSKICSNKFGGSLVVSCPNPASQRMTGLDFASTPPTPICTDIGGIVSCPDPIRQQLVAINFTTNPPTPVCNDAARRVGGAFTRHVGWTEAIYGSPGSPNPVTGTFGCPPGYMDIVVFQFKAGCGPYWIATAPNGPANGEYSPYGVKFMVNPAAPAGSLCGMEGHICVSP